MLKQNIPTAMTDPFTLANGVQIPCIGYGTWQTPNDQTRAAVSAALGLGYRHIDTAWCYGNEQGVGQGIRDSGVPRDQLFVTTKHWVTARGYEQTIAAVEDSLKNLGLDYLDLYLIHWPCVLRSDAAWEEINAQTWRGFEKMYNDGKIRALGVSNFQAKHLDALEKFCTVKPMVNQLEFHPGYLQWDNVRDSMERGILVEAWSPLGSGAVLQNELLASIGKRYGKTTAQVCVRSALQNGVLPLPKSVHPVRMAQNADVFDFALSEEECAKIAAMPTLGFSTYLPEEAPADALAGLLKK